jgi:drug/metabolite transporter, DME family
MSSQTSASATTASHAGPTRGRGAPLVLAAAALFGTIGTARVLGPDASSASVGAVRLLVAAVLLLAVAAPHGRSALRASWRLPGVWLAGVAQAAFNITFLGAVTRAGVAVGTLVAIGCTPILTGLASRRVNRSWVLATALALVGLTALLSQGIGRGVTVAGVGFALGAAASYATFIVSSSSLDRSPVDTSVKLAAIFTIAAVALAPALVLAPLHWAATARGAAMVLYLAVAATVLAYNLFNRGLRTLAPGTTATLGLAEPLVATVLGVVVLGERLSLLGWSGAVVVMAALTVMVRSTRRDSLHTNGRS